MEAYFKKPNTSQNSSSKHLSLRKIEHSRMPESSYNEPLRLALFDLDDTLITPKSHNRYSKNPKDWIFKFSNVVSKLKELQKKRYLIYIITNQLGIGKGFISFDDFEVKIRSILAAIDVNITVLIATDDDEYRKPFTGSWDHITKTLLKNHEVSKKHSFYVGDAAGRANDIDNNRLADHSNCDLLFAENVGLKFKTPEMFFDGDNKDYESLHLKRKREDLIIKPEQFIKHYFKRFPEILLVIKKNKGYSFINSEKSFILDRIINKKQLTINSGYKQAHKVIVLVNGPPHSGKSHLIDIFFKNQNVYSWVN